LKKIAILVENGFEDVELLYPYYRYQEAGYGVEVVGPKADEVSSSPGAGLQTVCAPSPVWSSW
jgi:protease I